MHFLLATEPLNGHPEFFENLGYQTVGILVVITSLGTLWLCVEILGRLLNAYAHQAAPAQSPAPAPASPPSTESSITPEICAAISAAITNVLGSEVQIHSITPSPKTQANPFVQAWSVEGRRQIFHSHTLR